jgi:hypothetical protein
MNRKKGSISGDISPDETTNTNRIKSLNRQPGFIPFFWKQEKGETSCAPAPNALEQPEVSLHSLQYSAALLLPLEEHTTARQQPC